MPDDFERYPEASIRDHVRTGVDSGIAAIPVLGGSIQTLADAVIVPSLTKRRENWLRKLGELLAELKEKVDGFDPASLSGDEVFVTAVADASRIAMGTHLEQKLDMLKNCLARLAVTQHRDDFLALQMFRFVDDLTPEHFVVLQYLSNPGAWFDAKGLIRPTFHPESPGAFMDAGNGALMDAANLPVTGASRQIVLRDLEDRGLATTKSLGPTTTETGIWQSMTTELGEQLLRFVEEI